MEMSEKIERSRQHARAALDAYKEAHDPGSVADVEPDCIADLIADLLHLAADQLGGVERRYIDLRQDVTDIADRAVSHFEHESDPANAGEEV